MSEKSFGDHINKNIVKNPLLSSAVTGLSLEDLTHKAVFLPASPSQELVTQRDQQQGSQVRTLANSDHVKPSFPSGDAFKNIPSSNTLPNIANLVDSQNDDKNRNFASGTQSKASVKSSQDDFDVNEYIARLQGTRYVSAPLHSHIKEDKNANLEAEECLEEINLNDSGPVEVQHSLTADIAQNFSQLPAVLPHVASAVFSSFSNMLSMKSREQTPDDAKTGYQEDQFQRQDVGVPLMGVEEAPKDFGLPPKEPPVTGSSNYRITSKKKYAQIPGLSYGDASQNVYPNPNIPSFPGHNVPPISTQDIHTNRSVDHSKDVTVLHSNTSAQKVPSFFTSDLSNYGVEISSSEIKPAVIDTNALVFDPVLSQTSGVAIPADNNNASNTCTYIEKTGAMSSVQDSTAPKEQQFMAFDQNDITAPRIPIIPPPPMFSNQKRDSQMLGGKSVLPPSVARRIGANQPIIKQASVPTYTDNIFVPFIPETSGINLSAAPPSISPADAVNSNQFMVQANVPMPQVNPPFFTPELSSVTSPVKACEDKPSQMPLPSTEPMFYKPQDTSSSIETPFFIPPSMESQVPLFNPSNTEAYHAYASNAYLPTAKANTTVSSSIVPPPMYGSNMYSPSVSAVSNPPSVPSTVSIMTSVSTLTSLPQMPTFSNPYQASQDTSTQAQATSDPVKPMVEPPKATGSLNFRMTKKRPQYYSGPIQGVGDISNNVKPVIAPVIPPSDTSAYQGSFFTPEQTSQVELIKTTAFFTPESDLTGDQGSCSIDHSSVPFDINKPTQLVSPIFESKPFDSFDMKQQSYGQEYNTAFDLSRPTTETFDSPKSEEKGFGIFDSLKSKLSTIDINKIQSTVTNFFDPVYNEGKVEKEAAHNVPQQYNQYSQGQSNFEIMVPGLEQNQNNYSQVGYQQGYNPDHYQYYQAQNPYYAQEQSTYYNEPNYLPVYTDPGINIKTSVQTNTQAIIPANIQISSCNIDQDSKIQEVVPVYNTAAIQEEIQAKSKIVTNLTQKCLEKEVRVDHISSDTLELAVRAVSDIEKPSYNPLREMEHKPPKPPANTISFFDSHPINVSKVCDHANVYIQETQTNVNDRNNAPLPPVMSFFDTPKDVAVEYKTCVGAPEIENIVMAEEIAIAPLQDINLLEAVCAPRVTEKIETDSSIFSRIEVASDRKNILPQEFLTKDNALAAYSIIGLSTKIEDLNLEIKHVEKGLNISQTDVATEPMAYFENQPSFSYFGNSGSEIIDEEPPKTVAGLIISDVKNVLLMEPPYDNIVTVLEKNTSSSLLTYLPDKEEQSRDNKQDRGSLGNFDRQIMSSKENVNVSLVRKPDEFFDHQIQDKPLEIETVNADVTSLDPDLSICETCREVNVADDKESENVTDQLIENINSSILLTNPVEALLTENIAVGSNRTFKNKEFNDIIQIAEDTMETLRAQSTTEHSEDVSGSKSNYRWSPEVFKYAAHLAAVNQEMYNSNTSSDPSNSDFTMNQYNVTTSLEGIFNTESNDSSFSLFLDSVPKNASDEIKAELKTHEDVIPRQMSIPSAPLEEEDAKSDETGGLDVLSIERDAKNDFPLEEEFIIEPSETDDDKLEFRERKRSSEDSVNDTFADRIEKFKNKVESAHDIYQTSTEYGPLKSMASYFDTGNYAVETHYRKSLTSPTNVTAFQQNMPYNAFHGNTPQTIQYNAGEKNITQAFEEQKSIQFNRANEFCDQGYMSSIPYRLPPGFEDEIRRQFNEQLARQGGTEPSIPDTTTQTRPIMTPTYASTSTVNDNYTIAGFTTDNTLKHGEIPSAEYQGKVETFFSLHNTGNEINSTLKSNNDTQTLAKSIEGTGSEPHTPETQTQTRPTTTTSYNLAHQKYTNTGSITKNQHENIQFSDISALSRLEIDNQLNVASNIASESKAPTLAQVFGGTNDMIKGVTQTYSTINAKDPDETKEISTTANAPLQDPINFFGSNVEEPKPTTEPTETLNRLASYFSMPPPKPDHSKSFFELSQSQNHYRHDTSSNFNIAKHKTDLNICLDTRTQANINNLMHDLTSPQNIVGDDVVSIVNFFSVELENVDTTIPKLDSILITNNVKCSEETTPNSETEQDNNKTNTGDTKTDSDSDVDDDINVINTCKYCCNILNRKDYKVKSATNTEKDNSKKEDKDANMSEKDDKKVRSNSISVDFGPTEREDKDGAAISSESRSSPEYTPVRHHWFYRVDVEDKSVWRGFSLVDSDALERAFLSSDLTEDTLIPTDGGRFDVNIIGRLRIAIYWKEKPTNVRRCSWFYKGTTDARYVPYTEAVADKLEEEYRHGVMTGEWHRRLVLPNSELVVMHGPAVMVHFLHGSATDPFSSPPFLLGKRVYRNPPKIRVAKDQQPTIDHLIMVVHGAGEYKRSDDQSTSRPRVVRRGREESEIEDSSPSSIDHLLLLCHGVGSACDMRFRSVEEVVEDFRTTSSQLLQSHYRNSFDNGIVSRVEVLPISWHAQLHVGEGGVDKRLNKVTLESIPRLRAFTNHTVLDALFYTSPVYHQTIIDTVCYELNRVYSVFKQRNPSFKGGVSLGGHSLGSVILYDLLCHQTPEKPIQIQTSAQKTYLSGSAQQSSRYPQLEFWPATLYALGSPIAIFECIRGVEALGLDFALPTCKNFFNIFHPYDPIAYRIEPLINPLLQDAKPFLIPHHKGRKRMHLELKDTMVRVGADLKQKLIESLRTTWNKWKASPPPEGQLEKVVEEEMEKEQLCEEANEEQINAELTKPEMLGKLNSGRRVDYVLQEAPLEMINEYLFAMSSHVGYWESEDTMLLMLREIYSSLGVQPDCTVPQQNLNVTRITRIDDVSAINGKEYPSTSRGSI